MNIFSHKEADCCKNPADLKNGTTKNETAAAAISNGVEFLLMAWECQNQGFPETHQLLSQLMIWIGHTATTMDMSGTAGDKKANRDGEHCYGQQTSQKVCCHQGNTWGCL